MNKFPQLAGIALIGFAIQCSGTRPNDIGVRESGRLKDCPPTPNCVTSFCEKDDTEHYIDPIAFSGDPGSAWKKLEATIKSQERIEVISKTDTYMHVEFTSKLMRYVDDVEFLLDAKSKKIHVRSASRLGRKDFGVNRTRIEKVRFEFNQP